MIHIIGSWEKTDYQQRHEDFGIDLVAGAQWWDEWKGKVTDILMDDPMAVGVRVNGWHNAGHTVVLPDGTEFDLHALPSGAVRPGRINIITSGCVMWLDLPKITLKDKLVDLTWGVLVFPQKLNDLYLDDEKKWWKKRCALIPELEQLMSKGVDVKSEPVKISAETPIIWVHHILLDALDEEMRKARPGWRAIGSTGSGITRAYESQKMGNHFSLDTLLNRPEEYCEHLRHYWSQYAHHFPNISIDELVALAEQDHYRLKSLQNEKLIEVLPDEKQYIQDLRQKWHKIVWELAQWALISERYSPFWTASNPSIETFCRVTGISPADIGNLFAVFKLPASSVWTRPKFLAYAETVILEALRAKYKEFGVSTGRPRDIFRYSLPEFAKSLALMIGDVFFPRDRVVPVFHRADGVHDFSELDWGHISVVTWWKYADRAKDILVWIHDSHEEINPDSAMRNYPDRITMGSEAMFQVDSQRDLTMRHIYGSTKNASPNNIPEWLEELLHMILQSMLTRSQIDEIILGWWPQRDKNNAYKTRRFLV